MSNMEIGRKIEIDMGHRIPEHKSQCRNVHGHRYVIWAKVSGALEEKGSSRGMVQDFGDIKEVLMREIHGSLDHGFMYAGFDEMMKDFFIKNPGMKHLEVDFVPTAENIARWCFERVDGYLTNRNRTLESIEVWETPNSIATYKINQ